MSARFIHRLRHYLPVWLTLMAGLALSGALGWELHREAVKLDADRFNLETRQIAAALESNMERYEERLARLADHCAQFEELPTQVWSFRQAAMTDLEGNLPAVRHALYCPKVVATNFQRHLDRGQLVWDGRYQFDPTPQPRRDLALPAWQAWGRSGFTAIARGTDMAAETNGHPSLRLALGTGRGWVSRHPVQAARHDGTIENGFWFALTLFASNQTVTVPSRPSM